MQYFFGLENFDANKKLLKGKENKIPILLVDFYFKESYEC